MRCRNRTTGLQSLEIARKLDESGLAPEVPPMKPDAHITTDIDAQVSINPSVFAFRVAVPKVGPDIELSLSCPMFSR
jgi:hypothetical protein